MGDQDKLEVLVIGAGFGGICAAIRLFQAGIGPFQVIDKHAGAGGTWYANTYPGATCDVPSHFYSLSFAPKPDWTHLYAPQAEILAYAESCIDRFGIRPHLRLNTRVTAMTFDGARGGWVVETDTGRRIFARFVINATGGLHHPKWPDIAGRADFGGTQMHTAAWDHGFDWRDKRIAVIGSAASAIQVIPELARKAARVDVYQRTPNYIAPRGDFAYSARQKRLFAHLPLWRRFYRAMIRLRLDLFLYPVIFNPARREKMAAAVRAHIARAGGDAALLPDHELGCKRILISDDFFASLRRANVELVTCGIKRITAQGIVDTTGRHREVDALIHATGFDFGAQTGALDITGRGGIRLADQWATQVEAYRGVMIAGFPNLFCVTGPNSGVGTTSVIHMIEQAVGWILRAMARTPPGNTIDASPEAQAAFNRDLHADLDRTVWATGCKSWYKRADGRIETLYPGNAAAYAREMRRLRLDELLIEPAG